MTTAGNIHRFREALRNNSALEEALYIKTNRVSVRVTAKVETDGHALHAAELLANHCGSKRTTRYATIADTLIFHF